ncbi:unnamed protein product [Prunus armeniaca]|uniref:Uncharacterized protein n=1 Tax=Prunus armeniaca TaxID=36596 RepID=A0A6J5WC68_PRUAR|nr:unnamed protein product [Prunus armeniaca]
MIPISSKHKLKIVPLEPKLILVSTRMNDTLNLLLLRACSSANISNYHPKRHGRHVPPQSDLDSVRSKFRFS